MKYDHKCPIWQTPASKSSTGKPDFLDKIDSPRAGGLYRIDSDTGKFFSRSEVDDNHKARITTWLVEQRLLGSQKPEITHAVIREMQKASNMRASERTDRILKFLAAKTKKLGTPVRIAQVPTKNTISLYENGEIIPAIKMSLELMADSESIDWDDLFFLLKYLLDNGLMECTQKCAIGPAGLISSKNYMLTVPGLTRVAELEQVKNEASDRAFVAMCFNPSFDDVWEKSIQPAVETAGYKPVRIDKEEHLDFIPDKIISEIRQSRFLVADFSCCKKDSPDEKDSSDDKRASEGVYYEAGFAHGFGIPVILTCKDFDTEGVHFDIDQYNRIQWKDPEDLRTRLTVRIEAVIGKGPHAKS